MCFAKNVWIFQTCDAYEEAIKQNNMQFNGQDSDVNYCTSETETDTEIATTENALQSWELLFKVVD